MPGIIETKGRALRFNGMRRRRAFTMLVCAMALASGPVQAQAQATGWPNRPVTVIVGYAAGGNTDVMARMAARKLSDDLKQSFVVENRIGAGGAIAAAYVAQAAPDGYTLFFAASPQIAIVPQLQKVSYEPRTDFAQVSIFGAGPFILGEYIFGKESGKRNNSQQFTPRQIVVLHRRKPPSSP